MKRNCKLLSLILLTGLLAMTFMQNTMAAEDSSTVAHWIFQNNDAFVSGDVTGDNFTVKDVTGNGNTLSVAKQGNVSDEQLIWAREGYNSARSSLLLNNQKAFADLDASDSYVDIIPVAKWLETVSNAPINDMTFTDGFTIEIIFKMSPDYDASYNRYSNLIERQGTVMGKYGSGATDPLFALATASNSGDQLISEDAPVGTQLLQMSEDGEEWTNREGDAILIPGKWYHMAAVNDGDETIVYLDGEEIITSYGKGIASDGYSWEIGIGRKYNDKADSALGNDLKGVPRRSFCGQYAEIKISNKALDSSQFINTAKTDVNIYLQPELSAEPANQTPAIPTEEVAASESGEQLAPAATVSEVPDVISVPQTGDVSIWLIALLAVSSIIFGLINSLKHKKD